MKKHLWKILIGIGILPILLPFILGVYHVNIESWTMGGWLIMYSYVYWPTYVLGLALIIVGVIKRKKGN